MHSGHGHGPGALRPRSVPPCPAVPGYLRVEGVARVRPPAQLLGAHPLTLHRSVVCEAVKDRQCGQGKGLDATHPHGAPVQAGLAVTAPPGRCRGGQGKGKGRSPCTGWRPLQAGACSARLCNGSRSTFSSLANTEMTRHVEPCIPACMEGYI